MCLLLTFPQSAAFLPGLCTFSTARHTSYPLRSADSADDKHLFSCSLYLRSLAWNSLAASVVIMVCYCLRGRDETESSAWGFDEQRKRTRIRWGACCGNHVDTGLSIHCTAVTNTPFKSVNHPYFTHCYIVLWFTWCHLAPLGHLTCLPALQPRGALFDQM